MSMIKASIRVNKQTIDASKDVSSFFSALDRLLYRVVKDIVSILFIVAGVFFVLGLASFVLLPSFFLTQNAAIRVLGILASLFIMLYTTNELRKKYRLHFSDV